MSAYIHTYTNKFVHLYVHTHMHVCLYTQLSVYIHIAYINTCTYRDMERCMSEMCITVHTCN